MTDYKLISNDNITSQITRLGINTWNNLCDYVQNLPYGRNNNRTDFSLVITEQQGTCSSKHALLKKVADLNNIQVKLIIGVYKMTQKNTPKIGAVLTDNKLDYIPEAHCYLKIDNHKFDFTSSSSNIKLIEQDILVEKEIEAEQVAYYKISFHKEFVKNWITTEGIHYSFDQIWDFRETCIKNLSKK